MEQVRKCQMYPELDADAKITYGLYSEYEKGRPHYEVYLSQKGSLELWTDQNSILVGLGLMHWVNEPIKLQSTVTK